MTLTLLRELERNGDKIRDDVWRHDGYDVITDGLLEVLAHLHSQLQVQKVLQSTATLLRQYSSAKSLPNQQATRVKHLLKFVFEKTTRGIDRQRRLRKLDCSALKVCGLSYTIKDLLELSSPQFDFLVENVADFAQHQELVQYLYREDINKGLHGEFDAEDDFLFKEFLKSHIELRPVKRKRDENDQRLEPEARDPSDRASACAEGVTESPSSTDRPPQQRRNGGEGSPTVQPREFARGNKNEYLPVMRTGRQIDYRCSEAPISHMQLLREPIYTAVADSNQWKWEREVGGMTTDCMNALVPEDPTQDISITLSVGHKKGLEIIDTFNLASL